MNFNGKTAVSTGAASGMGLLFCQEFARLGGNVVMCDVNEEALQAQVAAINALSGGRALGIVCDVRDYQQVCDARDKAVAEFGSIDVLVNFAGGSATRVHHVAKELEFPDVPIEVYDWGIDVNLKGAFYFAHAVMKQMREQKSGVVVNIGSITGAEGSKKALDYATSKAGLMYGLTKSLAQFGSAYGIRCVCVAPGPVMTREAMAKMKTMLGRAGKPQEIVDLVLYLVSDKSAFITGETIMIDGGRNAMSHW